MKEQTEKEKNLTTVKKKQKMQKLAYRFFTQIGIDLRRQNSKILMDEKCRYFIVLKINYCFHIYMKHTSHAIQK